MNSSSTQDDRIQSAIEQLKSIGMAISKAVAPDPVPSDHVFDAAQIAAAIEHTLLAPDATRGAVRQLCEEATEFRFCGVCVNPVYVPDAKRLLEKIGCQVVTVVGFPLGSNLTRTKADEAKRVVEAGATEVDMVLHVGGLKAGEFAAVENDIRSVVDAAGAAAVKVIIEACLLTDEEKILACLLAMSGGAAFVKTSTGFSKSGATEDDVQLMRAVVGDRLGVKAAGGIRDLETAQAMLAVGANRLGCSAAVQIMREAQTQPR